MMGVVNNSPKNPVPGNENVNNLNSDANYVICDKLSIYYQNVQGLIPFTGLNKTHPNLDNTKLSELHAYVYDKRLDIIILKETWLNLKLNPINLHLHPLTSNYIPSTTTSTPLTPNYTPQPPPPPQPLPPPPLNFKLHPLNLHRLLTPDYIPSTSTSTP